MNGLFFQCLLIFTFNIDSVKLSLLSVQEGGIGRFSRQILQEKFVCRFRRIKLLAQPCGSQHHLLIPNVPVIYIEFF